MHLWKYVLMVYLIILFIAIVQIEKVAKTEILKGHQKKWFYKVVISENEEVPRGSWKKKASKIIIVKDYPGIN
jgi:hypothetical protein